MTNINIFGFFKKVYGYQRVFFVSVVRNSCNLTESRTSPRPMFVSLLILKCTSGKAIASRPEMDIHFPTTINVCHYYKQWQLKPHILKRCESHLKFFPSIYTMQTLCKSREWITNTRVRILNPRERILQNLL